MEQDRRAHHFPRVKLIPHTPMIPLATLIEHGLAIGLLAVYPAWDYFDTRELRAGVNPKAKLRYYKKTFLLEWIAAILAIRAAGRTIFLVHVEPLRLASLHPVISKILSLGFAALIVFVVLAPHVQSLFNPRVREKFGRQIARLSSFLPKTPSEFRWYEILSVTAGVCEEVLYRAFLFHYFAVSPWHWGLTAALLISSVAFSAAHLYQGKSGAISSGIGGLIFGALFLLTGNLLLSVITHIAADLIASPILRLSAADHAKA
jgi:uncharacterized protein